MILSRNQFFLLLLLLFVGPFYASRAWWLIHSKHTTGKGWFTGHTLELQGNITSHLVVLFNVGNDSYYFNGRGFRVGDSVPVRYQETNPFNAKVDTFSGLWEDIVINSLLPELVLLILYLTPAKFDPLIPRKSRILIGKKPFIKIISP
jgi:hypothetical protein